ncbi:guanine nucleotide-binding protein G(o) subunit alpha-like [Ambystoma mexicanum]|uniref:guanine nucleotide-binding protein G(o) subunit alpha-like n=1 Tax=Ambystoma mexicanum TaxID=8296 RepID=UPI0037E9451A
MGLCFGTPVPQELQVAQSLNERIDKEIYEQAKQELNTLRVLILGAAESGKSTLVKQLKIMHSRGFTQQELRSFKPAVLDNLLCAMKFVLHGMGLLRINLVDRENRNPASFILSCSRCFDEHHLVFPCVSRALHQLWADAGVRAAAARGLEYELNDSAHYFFEHMGRILSSDFCPTAQDVLRVRVRTCGVLETHFDMRGFTFRVYDVGGLHTERRKWISFFEDVNAVLFVVALSGYDTRLHKADAKLHVDDVRLQAAAPVNPLRENLKLFGSICSNLFFKNSSMILFLNKMDLFQQKILYLEQHLRYYFPMYTGADCDVTSAASYIASLFLGINALSTKRVYHHFTTAIDTTSVQIVFQVVMDSIIKDNLQAIYLL